MKHIKILGSGKYLPKKIVSSSEIDLIIGEKDGWTEKKSGVKFRHFADEKETTSFMGAEALKNAVKNSGINMTDIDCIVSVSGTYEQAIPCNASLIQEKLGLSTVPCFDINSTCLSFVTGLDTLSYLLNAGKYNRIALVSSEIASVGVNWEQKNSCILFGDAAVCFIIEKGNENKTAFSLMETYSEAAHTTEIRGGGTRIHPKNYNEENKQDFLFDMDGKTVFKVASKYINGFVDRLFANTEKNISDIQLVVPHQASGMAMRIMKKKLGVENDKFMETIDKYGNTIASSIPLALHDALNEERLKEGDLVLLLGTSAGLSIGGIVFEI